MLLRIDYNTQNSWFDLSTFISTVIGGLLVLWFTYFTQIGKLHFFVRKRIFSFKKRINTQLVNVNPNPDDNEIISAMWLAVDVYNSSNFVLIARDVKLRIITANKTFTVGVFSGKDEITSLNFSPKNVKVLHLFASINEQINLKNEANISLIYKNAKGKEKIFLIH